MPIDITDVTRRVQYAGSGTGPYNFTFQILDDDDIAVYQDDTLLVKTTDYTVTINVDGTGSITTVSSIPGADNITIIGARPYARLTDFSTGGDFFADDVNDELDSILILIQQLREEIGRALQLSSTSTFSGSLAFPAPGAGEYLRWNVAGTALETVSASPDEGVFQQSGTGSVERSWTAKVGEIVSVKDFGAVGEGVTNDDAAFDLVEALDDEFIYIPAGSYVTDTELKKHYYGPGTINGKPLFNFDRIQPLPQAARMWHKIRQNAEDVQILVLGDSTGNATNEWVYKWATHLGVDVPTHSIKYRLFASGAWGSETVISTGSGSQSIIIDNASVSGANTSSLFTGDQRALVYSLSRTYDVVIFNLGHNEGSSNPYAVMFARYTSAVIETKTMNPRADLFCTLQNPDTGQLAFSARQTAAWREIAELYGLGAINVYDVFNALGRPAGLYADATHPNEAGMRVWAAIVRQAMSESMTHQWHRHPQNALNDKRAQLAPNPFFNEWGASGPLGWTLNNVTAAKDTAKEETFSYALKLTTSVASNPNASASLAAHLNFLKGKWITFIARVYRPTASDATAGRLGISLGVGTDVTSPSFTSVDGYYWSVCQAYIPTNENSIDLQILGGATLNDEVWIDRVSCVVGLIPSEPDPTEPIIEESGDWTPTLTTAGTSFDAVTYDAITGGRYIKQGRKVTVTGLLRTDSVTVGGATSNVVIGGLPYPCASGNKYYSSAAISSVSGFGGDMPVNARVTTGGSTIELFYRTAVNGADISLAVADVGTGANANTLAFSATYFTE